MRYSNFISANEERCSFDHYVAAPYFRKAFQIEAKAASGELVICGLGFYRVFINETEITKGALAPYMSNTDDIVYFDRYDIGEYIQAGTNVIGIILGNGLQNAFGGYTWDFDKAGFQSEPKLSLSMNIILASGKSIVVESDESFKTHASPIIFNDLWCGEYYDSNLETEQWLQIGFDASGWDNARRTGTPRGEQRICEALPIVCAGQIRPAAITKYEDGYLYDFGINTAGVCELRISGTKGQAVSLEHGEHLINGRLDLKNIQFVPDGYVQRDRFICSGRGMQYYKPSFTYHGFRYVYVTGITEEQAVPELLTYHVLHAALEERGGFSCSDPMINQLQELTRRSTLANFYHFPTDCPQREKNGWTGDAQLSAEHTILNLAPERSWTEWLRNIRKAQDEDGRLPGIVPTGGWGMGLGGPAWDSVIINLPYVMYRYRGRLDVLHENKTAIMRYIHYLSCARNEKGLLDIGLGDWCPAGHDVRDFKAPVAVTDTALAVDLCRKASIIFKAIKCDAEQEYALRLSGEFRESARKHLIDYDNMTAAGECQTSQAVFLYYRLFDKEEEAGAVEALVRLIHKEDDHIDTGIIGGRVIFHVLAQHGYADLAYHMITRTDFPSYGNWVSRGATTLWESFDREGGTVASLNHHMWGDISAWFIKRLAGIQINPSGMNVSEVIISPVFPTGLDYACGWHDTPKGRVQVSWERLPQGVRMDIEVPDGMTGVLMTGGQEIVVNGKRSYHRNLQGGIVNVI